MRPTDHCPRYFCHWIDLLDGTRLTFGSALLVPLSLFQAYLFQSDGRGCFALNETRRNLGRVTGIQYAITVVDEERGVLHEEKFNHDFVSDTVSLRLNGEGFFVLSATGRPLYRSYPRHEVLDLPGRSRQSVLQFVA